MSWSAPIGYAVDYAAGIFGFLGRQPVGSDVLLIADGLGAIFAQFMKPAGPRLQDAFPVWVQGESPHTTQARMGQAPIPIVSGEADDEYTFHNGKVRICDCMQVSLQRI